MSEASLQTWMQDVDIHSMAAASVSKKLRTEPPRASFRATVAGSASSFVDCARLPNNVLMPWVGFGTYKL